METSTMQIRTGDTYDPRVVALLDHHVTAARAQTAPGSAHALDLAGLRAPDVAFWTGWDGETLVATGALKTLSASHGEVKSMHTLQTRGGAVMAAGCCVTSSRRLVRAA